MPATERAEGVESSQDDSTPNRRGGGVESWQDELTPNGMGGGVESSQEDSTPREAEGPRGDETLRALTASRYRRGEDGQGQGGGRNPPAAGGTREQGPDGGGGAARRGAARRGATEWRCRTRQWRRRREPAEQGTRPNTSTAQLALRPETASTCAVSTTRWCWRHRKEAKPAREPCDRRGWPWGHDPQRGTDSGDPNEV